MKKILLVSDNHKKAKIINFLINKHYDVDYFIHCGDSEMNKAELNNFLSVKGNCDFDANFDDEYILEIKSHRILIVHGHKHNVYKDYNFLVDYAKFKNCNLIFFGHLHLFIDEKIDGIRIVNPGSLFKNRDGSFCSYAIVYLDDEFIKVERMNINDRF